MTRTRKITGDGGGREASPQEDLSRPILLADRLKKAAAAARSFRADCSQLAHRADLLAAALRAALRRLSTLPRQPPYAHPIRRVAAAAARSLDRAISLARRRRRRFLIRLLLPFATTGAADFRRALALLDASLADVRWLISLYSGDDDQGDGGAAAAYVGVELSLPPIAANDPVLSYVWTCVAAVQMAARSSDRADAAQFLANLALDGRRNRWVIVDEGGVPPLLVLLKDGDDEASQSAAAAALVNISTDRELVFAVADALAIPTIVQTLSNSTSTRLQTRLASLISRMAEADAIVREEFAAENVIHSLVALLSSEVPLIDVNHAIPFMKKSTSGLATASLSNRSPRVFLTNGNSDVDEREHESAAAKLELQTECAEALWMLCKDSIANCRKVAQTIGLLCLAKLMETEKDQLQFNCLMTVLEIAVAAESDAELRGSFKKNSPAAKSVIEQLLRLVQQERRPSFQSAAIRSIGSLARIFPARETQVLQPLVAQLGHWDSDVSADAAMALGKFASPDNFLCVEHSTAIVEFEGVLPLMRLLRPGEKSQLPGLVLLCYLALHVPSHEALERAKVLLTLKSVSQSAVAQHPSLKELLPKAIHQLELYRPGALMCIDIDISPDM